MKMGELRLDVPNFITCALVGFVGVWCINRLLAKAGKTAWQA
jgi:hypothetical protein